MKSRVAINLFLALLITVLAAVLWLSENEPTEPVNKLLPQLESQTVNRIEIVRNKQPTTQLIMYNNTWVMTTPITARVNQHQLNSIIDIVNTPSFSQFAANDSELVKYGLADSSAAITFNNTKIVFGDINPLNKQRYVYIGHSIHMITDNILPLIKGAPASLISSQLLPPSVRLVRLVLPETTLTLVDALWRSDKKEHYALSQDQFNMFIDEWRYAHALYVTVSNKKPAIKARNNNVIKIQFSDKQETSFIIQELANDVLLTRVNDEAMNKNTQQIIYHMRVEAGHQLLQFPSTGG